MKTYLLNKNDVAFFTEESTISLDALKAAGCTIFTDYEEFMKVWSERTGIDADELECAEYWILLHEGNYYCVANGFESEIEIDVVEYIAQYEI